jgi:hypothetical protein
VLYSGAAYIPGFTEMLKAIRAGVDKVIEGRKRLALVTKTLVDDAVASYG